MLKRLALILGGFAAALLVAFCSDKPTEPTANPLAELKARLEQTPRLNREAEEMALWVSGALVAPQSLYFEFDSSLKALRSEWGDSVPLLEQMRFIAPRQPSLVKLYFDSIGREELLSSDYQDWDSLNTLFRMTSMDTTLVLDQLIIRIRFSGILNSDSLASYYSRLPVVADAASSCSICIGDYGNLYPGQAGDGLRFLLRRAGGDCLADCTENHFWCFVQDTHSWDLVGDFDLIDSESIPDWWWEGASELFCSFRHRGDLCRE